jgi:hypothetical protein
MVTRPLRRTAGFRPNRPKIRLKSHRQDWPDVNTWRAISLTFGDRVNPRLFGDGANVNADLDAPAFIAQASLHPKLSDR